MRPRLHGFHAVAALACVVAIGAAQERDPLDLVNEARKLNSQGDQDGALALYRQVLARVPDSFDARYGSGIALDLKSMFADARAEFTKAIELAPADLKVQALTGMAVSYAFTADAAGSARFYGQIFDRQTADADYAGAAETANALGRVYLETGHTADATKWYETGYETARRQPDLPGAQLDLADLRWAHAQARIAARKGDRATARRQIAAVTKLVEKGDNPEQQIQLPYLTGYVAFFLKDYAGAISALERADQTDPFIVALLAQAQEASGHASIARELYQKVLTFNNHSLNNAFARPLAKRKLQAHG